MRHYLPVHPVWFVKPYWSRKIILYQDKYFVISRLVFCDASCVLTWIPFYKDESSISGILSISISIGNSPLSLDAALLDWFNTQDV